MNQLTTAAPSQPEVIFDPAKIDWDRPGKHHYQLAFPLDGSWGYSLVPLTVINGLKGANPNGIVTFGGTHGNEWEGPVAIKRLCRDLDPAALSGRIILIPQLSESAGNSNTRTSPLDGVNMNRAFPGNARGTISYRIANFVKTRIFPQVRVVLDIHSGGNEGIFPHVVSFHPVANTQQRSEMAQVARLFDTPFVMIYSSEMASGLLTDEAEAEGKITIGSEFGYGEAVNRQGTLHAYEGIKNVLRHYNLLDEPVSRIDPDRKTPTRFIEAAKLHNYIPAPCDGIWEPLVDPGDDVRNGQLIGRMHNFNDHTSAPMDIQAPGDGVILMMHFPAVTKKGYTLFSVGEEVDI
ncbi:MAG: succinylglutamate desuccinylase/aspartoacylase family protein [Bryobacteraceae bacterium]